MRIITLADELAADIATLDTFTPDQLLHATAGAERLAATGNDDQWDRAYRAELEKRAPTRSTATASTSTSTDDRFGGPPLNGPPTGPGAPCPTTLSTCSRTSR